MKYFIYLLALMPFHLCAQLSGIIWQNTIGGTADDEASVIRETPDGGYIIGAWSMSGTGIDKTENNLGSWDYWIIKLDANKQIQWQQTIGSTSVDVLTNIICLNDGGYVAIGFSGSPASTDKSEPAYGSWDYWVVRLDSLGNILWDNTLGGSGGDVPYGIVENPDGSFVICGYSSSGLENDKLEPNYGENDAWIIRLNSQGNLIAQNSIGGVGHDVMNEIISCNSGGYLLSGYSLSNSSPDKSEDNFGMHDAWLVKLDENLNIEWENTIGGSGWDAAYELLQTEDGGFLLGIKSSSDISDDKDENSTGVADFWILKLDETGFNIEWQNTIGGSGDDHPMSIKELEGGDFLFAGYTNSGSSNDKAESGYGEYDYWIMRLGPTGEVLWENTLGGSQMDELWHLEMTSTGELLLLGNSLSGTSQDKSEQNHGGRDIWLVQHTIDAPLAWFDFDGDGFGGSDLSLPTFVLPDGFAENSGDCNDINPFVNPAAQDICNGIDDDCSGLADEGFGDCVGDYTHDSSVNISDFLILSSVFGSAFVCPFYDLTGDGTINVSDFLVFTAVFGVDCASNQ
ncbi:MAG: putative metal-binding motif-containing protein [Flavobacteriales bacterium]|nr:putative metal-binding motif-containing protein [Flavobacteriales bacterium]